MWRTANGIRELVITGIAVAFISFASVGNAAQLQKTSAYGSGYGMWPGMMGGYGYGMMGRAGYGMGAGMMMGGMGYGMNPAMMMGGAGYGTMGPGMMMGGMGYGSMMAGLSQAQRDKLEKIVEATRKANWALMGKMMDHMTALWDLYRADTLDAKKIGAVYGKLFDLRRQMIENQVEAINKYRGLLTKEQKDALRNYWSNMPYGMRGYPGATGQGHRGAGMMGQ